MHDPPIILVGGTAGCGKTTLAGRLTAHFDLDHRIGTGFIRAVLQSQSDLVTEPELFHRTYEAADPVASVQAQAQRLQPAVLACIERARDEGTSLVIEGTHLLPALYCRQDVAFVVLEQPPTSREHVRRLTGGRHTRRAVEAVDVQRLRLIGDFYRDEAHRLGVVSTPYHDNFDEICALIGLSPPAVDRSVGCVRPDGPERGPPVARWAMETIDYAGLLVVAVVAFVAPLAAGVIPRKLVPPVVLEVLFGYAVGPQGFGWVRVRGAVDVLYLLGLGFLLFLAGQDVEPARFRGPTFRRCAMAFVASLVLSFPVAAGLRLMAPHADLRLLALTLTASSLGVLIPVLRDAGEITSEFGQMVVMAGSVGEFGALLLLTILFSAQPESTTVQILYVVAMGAAALLTGLALTRLWRSGWMARVLLLTDRTTSPLRIRGAFVMLMIFTGLAHRFGVDALLGAFIAGVVLSVSDGDNRPDQEAYWAKLQAIGFGFLVPVFFVATGVQLDLRSLIHHGSSLAFVPVLIGAIAVVRGGPALVYRGRIGARASIAAGLLQATTLTFPVVVASLGLQLGLIDPASAAALVGAALLSVLLFPAAALALRPWTSAEPPTVDPSPPSDPPTAHPARPAG